MPKWSSRCKLSSMFETFLFVPRCLKTWLNELQRTVIEVWNINFKLKIELTSTGQTWCCCRSVRRRWRGWTPTCEARAAGPTGEGSSGMAWNGTANMIQHILHWKSWKVFRIFYWKSSKGLSIFYSKNLEKNKKDFYLPEVEGECEVTLYFIF